MTLMAAATLLVSGFTAQAVPVGPTFSFHENGNGQLELPNGVIIPLAGTLTSDPGPGGLLSALAFTTHPQEGAAFTVGDVLMRDGSGHISDVLRFSPATSSDTGLTQLIFLYSNDSVGLLADTGLPMAFYFNSVSLVETQNGATIFVPSDGQPGFLPVAPVPITYRIFSTPDTGTTLSLFSVAILGLALLQRTLALS